MPLQAGDTLLNGKYRIVKLLGRGGFGFVYLAHDTLLQEEVALKELIPALAGDEEMLKRFLTEAKATIRLTHKRIVRTHDVFAERGNYYIAMEYMPGGTLEQRLRDKGRLAVDEAVQTAADMCEALGCAHEDGVVHCDLKPANILFGADGRAKVADFGIAHIPTEMFTRSWATPSGFVAGTLPYMSPEQAEGVRDEPRADIYALGAVLYRMLTGRPYLDFDQRDTPMAQARNAQRIQGEMPAPPSTYQRDVPAWLDGVVIEALAKRPDDRHPGAAEMRSALLRRGADAVASPASGEATLVPPELQRRAVPERSGSSIHASAAPPEPKADAPTPPSAGATPASSAAPVQPALVAEEAAAIGDREAVRASPISPEHASRAVMGSRLPAWIWLASGGGVVLLLAVIILVVSQTARGKSSSFFTSAPSTSTPSPAPPTAQPPGIGSARTSPIDGMVQVYVPAGEFLMGSPAGDTKAQKDEMPQHQVYLDAFWIDRTEVTNVQYAKCVAAGACRTPLKTSSETRSTYFDDRQYDNFPVIYVSWNDAGAYCQWAGRRLPTEAEWEKAARGVDFTHAYPWGDGAPTCTLVNGNVSGRCVDDTNAVGSYPAGASLCGALDMAGNVWEWVNDRYSDTYYNTSSKSNPSGPAEGAYRVLRGGSWYDSDNDLRAANRDYNNPTLLSSLVGFRCVAAPGG